MKYTVDPPILRKTISAITVGEGRELRVLLHDPLRISSSELLLTPELFFMVRLFNGDYTSEQISELCTKRLNRVVTKKQVEHVTKTLSDSLFLENERFQEALGEQTAAFNVLERRPASHAGRAYPADAAELKNLIDGFFTTLGGPGVIGEKKKRKCLGIAAPHIDFQRGGVGFAHAFKALAESAHENTVFVLAVNHGPSNLLYPAIRKDFETPLGIVETDREFLDAMAEVYKSDLFSDEFAHKNEHSLEFQAVMMAYALPGVKIVPVLASGFSEFTSRGIKPAAHEIVKSFVESVAHAVQKTGRGVTLIAGIDLAHVGVRFGQKPVDKETAEKVKTDDMELLAAAASGDADRMSELVLKDGDARNICGYPALYTFLRLLGGRKGEILYYDQSPEPQTQSMVSFASMAFFE
jgi:hypothetical protein